MYPSLNQFQRWASEYNAIPVWIEPELPAGEMLDWVHNLVGAQQKFFFLHSASVGEQSRYSYIGLDSPRYSIEARQGELTLRYQAETGSRHEILKIGNAFDRFHEWFSRWKAPRVDALPPFWGGAVGYLGYEAARYMDPRLAHLFQDKTKDAAPSTEGFIDFEFGLFDAVAAIDQARGRLWLVHTVLLPQGRKLSPTQIEKLYRSAQDRCGVKLFACKKPFGTSVLGGIFRQVDCAATGRRRLMS